MGDQIGFIYSIQIQILHSNADGYMSWVNQGFQTCHLVERHWKIVNHETGQSKPYYEIGTSPILWERGFKENGYDKHGPFLCIPVLYGTDGQGWDLWAGYLIFVPDPPPILVGRRKRGHPDIDGEG